MRGASLSDLHLGFRAFSSTTGGRNTREVDVEAAFAAAVDQIVAHAPQVVTIAGDVFHHPRVSDFAKKTFIDGIRRLLTMEAVVIVLQGNHDAGRTSDVLTPIMLVDGFPGAGQLFVVTHPQRIRFRTLGQEVAVACFPFVTRGNGVTYKLEPDPDADLNILVMHAAVRGDAEGEQLPYFYAGAEAVDVGREADRWDVIHCGDFHEFRQLHPERLAFYSGSLERTSSNIWDEHEPKGWVLWDSEARTLELRVVGSRPMWDRQLRDGVGDGPLSEPTAENLNRTLEVLLGAQQHEGAIVRLKVDDFPRAERQDIDWALVRKLKASCTHFRLDLRFAKAEAEDLGDRRDRRVATLAEEFRQFFTLLDDASIRKLAQRYLEIELEAEDLEEQEEQLQEVPA